MPSQPSRRAARHGPRPPGSPSRRAARPEPRSTAAHIFQRHLRNNSLPRSAWECRPGRSAASSAETPRRRGASKNAFPRGAWERVNVSLGRDLRQPLRCGAAVASPPGEPEIRPYDPMSSASFSSSSSPTTCGSALPPVCFITWPRRKPLTASGFFLPPPLRSSRAFGLAAMACVDRRSDCVAVGDHAVAALGDDRVERVARLDQFRRGPRAPGSC